MPKSPYELTGQKAQDEKKAAEASSDQSALLNEELQKPISQHRKTPTPSGAAQAGHLRPTPTPTADPKAKYNKYKAEGGTADYSTWLASR